MRAKVVRDMIRHGLGDVKKLTIGEAMVLKNVFGLTNSEAVDVFLGGTEYENLQV